MENQDEKASLPQGSNDAMPGGLVSNTEEKVEALTSLEQDRYFSISHVFGDGSFEVLSYFKGKKTPFQWTNFMKNVHLVNDPNCEFKDYLLDLKQEFLVKEPYRQVGLANRVIECRVKHKLPAFTTDVLKSCLTELGKVFLVEETKEYNEDGKTTHPVYTPVFSIMIVT